MEFNLLELVILDKAVTAEYWRIKEERSRKFSATQSDIYKVPCPREFELEAILTKIVRAKIDYMPEGD